jgi:hypothetical protein
MRRSERVWRGLLALVIVGTIPLSMWGSGCSSQPLVQPDAGQTGGSPGTGGVPGTGGLAGTGGLPGSGGHSSGGSSGTGGSQPRDASADALSLCCSESEDQTAQCSPDGKQLRQCFYNSTYPTSRQCSGGTSDYAYLWDVQTCPYGCVTVDGGLAGAGGAPAFAGAKCQSLGTRGSSGTGGVSGAGGSGPRDASADGPSPCCSQAESQTAQCTSDGKQLRYCNFSLTSGPTAQCRTVSTNSYAYVWGVQTCANTCVTFDAGQVGTSAKCQ